MIYKMLPKQGWQEQTFARIDNDGLCRVTCIAENPEFQAHIKAGAELQDAEGVVMTDAEAKAYVATLP
jgi:hypothetical protein